jgi:hypothetical protein
MKVFAISVNLRKSDSLVLTSSLADPPTHTHTHTHVGLCKVIGPMRYYVLFCPVQSPTEYECVDPEDLLLLNFSEYEQPKGAA